MQAIETRLRHRHACSARRFRTALAAVARRALACAVAITALVAGPRPCRAADPDPWLARDKALHFGASLAISSAGYTFGAAVFESRGHALLLGGGLAAAAGLGKEALDLAGYGDPSWKDLAWDGIGTLVGLGLTWGVDLLVGGISDRHPAIGAPGQAVRPVGVRIVF